MSGEPFSVVILAAGKATRFKSERSKVLHRLAGRPLGEYVLRTAFAAGPERTYLIIGHDAEDVRMIFARPGLIFIEQKEQLGTGHALIVAREELERCPSPFIAVLVGDAPLLRPETLRHLVEAQAKARAAAAVLTTKLPNAYGYGRIVRSGNRVRAIVEEKVATPAQRKIQEINSGIICFSRPKLLQSLSELSRDNAQREYLLTDLIGIFNRQREKVIAVTAADPLEVLGVNSRAELGEMERILRLRKTDSLMREGVTVVNPEATYIEADVEVGSDTIIEPGVSLRGQTRIGRECRLQVYSTIADSVLGDRVNVRPYSLVVSCEIGSDALIGPFVHLRDGAVIESEARVGNFVEVKKSRVGRGTKASHLTYLGDATLGEQVNIGAGTVTCNYDGQKKNPTIIEDGAFIGSGTMLVAPVRVGRGSITAAGSAITEDVPPESLAFARARQVNKEGWVRNRSGGKTESTASITLREVGRAVILDVAGSLTLGRTVEELRQKIQDKVRTGSAQIIVNLAQTVQVDSAGVGALVAVMTTVHKAGGRLKLAGIPQQVLNSMQVARLDRAFEIHPNADAALASFVGTPAT